ncbi:MAG TPA: isoprenylcysteine carboxylmethyltransferase family protein [Caulobacteraceae bacterium]|jgi:protein-S-isoprenylcysteine O-methyltransferase|nr:isoprenylcysteine carboxylmethyltransferase family protein [Caulobacteraceae bacterium]
MPHILSLYARGPTWQVLFWTSYAVWIGSEVFILLRDRRAATGEAEDRGSRRFIFATYAVGLVAGFTCANRLAWGRIGFDPRVVFGAGLATMWAGMALRWWAVATLGRFFRTSVQVLDDHTLVTTGPYARLRNPAYTGSVLTLVGLGVALGSWPGLALVVLIPLVGFVRRIAVEEAALQRRFGPAFDAYRRGRWALIPLVW